MDSVFRATRAALALALMLLWMESSGLLVKLERTWCTSFSIEAVVNTRTPFGQDGATSAMKNRSLWSHVTIMNIEGMKYSTDKVTLLWCISSSTITKAGLQGLLVSWANICRHGRSLWSHLSNVKQHLQSESTFASASSSGRAIWLRWSNNHDSKFAKPFWVSWSSICNDARKLAKPFEQHEAAPTITVTPYVIRIRNT